MFEDPNTGKPMLLGEVLIDELKQEPFSEWYPACRLPAADGSGGTQYRGNDGPPSR